MDDILDRIGEMPESSMRELSAMNISRNMVWRVLRDDGMHQYHVQRIQGLEPVDYQAELILPRRFSSRQLWTLNFVLMCCSWMTAHSQARVF